VSAPVALDAVRRGFKTFLLEPNTNVPLIPNWREVATTDPDQIRACWALCPDANIGISTENLLTLRITERCPPATVAQLTLLFQEHDAPKSVCTARERPNRSIDICLHFSLPDGAVMEAKSDVFFAGIDLLSNKDFVVGPGSVLDGNVCTFANNNSLSPASPWLMEMCGVELAAESKSMNVVALKKPAPAVPLAPIKTKLHWALEAAEYLPVHPLRWYVHPGKNATPEQFEAAAKAAKSPLILNWQNLTTQDPEQIRKWWKQWPDANIGGATNNLVVVDIDRRNGGDETFAQLEMVESFPDTATTRTWSGGRHLIYVAPNGPVKGGTHALGLGVDVKARGGYVLMPGSTIEGRPYTREDSRPGYFAPQWILDKLKAAKPKTSAAGKRIVEEDEQAVELATQWMLNKAPIAETGNIDNTTYKVLARLYDFGVTSETALDIAMEWNDLKCNPPQAMEDLERICESAGRNRENAIGSAHPLAPGFEAVEIEERPAPPLAPREMGIAASATGTASGKAPPIKAVPLAPFDADDMPDRPWVLAQFACRGNVSALVGPAGMSKSTLLLMTAVAMASGRNDICGFVVAEPGPVWVWNQEDDMQEMQRRIAAIMKAFSVSWDDMRGADGAVRLFVSSGVDRPLLLAVRKDFGVIEGTPQVDEIIAEVKAKGIVAFMADPLVEFHEGDENNNIQMRAVVGQVRRIAHEGDCAAILAAHTRKPPQASSDGFAGDMDQMRGGGSQVGTVRFGATLFGMSPKDAKAYILPPGKTHHNFVRLDVGKINVGPKPTEPMWFERESITIGGGFERKGESVGYLRPVTLAKKAATTTSTIHLPTILAEIIATKLSREKHFKVSDVLASGTPAQQALLGELNDKKNRARCLADAFEGSDASPTDAGILTKTSARGKEVTLYLGPASSLPQQPKAGGRGLENAEDTEA
jgi:hypothetical protein